jgi:hypothetical protein
MPSNPQPDLAALRDQHPRWQITSHWLTSSSGPDTHIWLAQRGTVTITASTTASLTEQIAQAERDPR